MALDLNAFIEDVHKNSVAHGWWNEDRDLAQIIALIHSEISEALEEYRANRPLVWFACDEGGANAPCNPRDGYDCENYGREADCPYRNKKPEGIAIELIDCVIRILDLLGATGAHLNDNTIEKLVDNISDYTKKEIDGCTFPALAAYMHAIVSHAYDAIDTIDKMESYLTACAAVIFYWITCQGEDAERLLVLKHEYNKTRPYRHGNKAC